MSRFLKGFLRLVAGIVLLVGPLLATVMIIGGASGVLGATDRFSQAGVGVTLGLYFLFWSLVIGGILRLLLSIDDRLERLEGKH